MQIYYQLKLPNYNKFKMLAYVIENNSNKRVWVWDCARVSTVHTHLDVVARSSRSVIARKRTHDARAHAHCLLRCTGRASRHRRTL